MQVLLNLLRNAFDAMENVEAGDRCVTIQTLLTEDQMIEIRVIDTGEGLPDDNTARVFDTFFTTRPDGLGIGLPLCHRIIETHGGKIWMKNNSDCGATSTFLLPLNRGRHYGKLQADSIYCR
jgi:signal transduction histidine kinase